MDPKPPRLTVDPLTVELREVATRLATAAPVAAAAALEEEECQEERPEEELDELDREEDRAAQISSALGRFWARASWQARSRSRALLLAEITAEPTRPPPPSRTRAMIAGRRMAGRVAIRAWPAKPSFAPRVGFFGLAAKGAGNGGGGGAQRGQEVAHPRRAQAQRRANNGKACHDRAM